MRVYCKSRGIPLPKLGSFEYFVVSSAMDRDRTEKVAFARLLTGVLGKGLGLSVKEIMPFIEDYAEEVFQLKYNYKYTSAKVKKVAERLEKQSEDQRLLSKVARMTIKDV